MSAPKRDAEISEDHDPWEKMMDQKEAELERLRIYYARCAVCSCDLLPPAHPPHCHTCTVDDVVVSTWEESVK